MQGPEMATAIGVVTLVAGLVAWIGQSLALLAPSVAVRLGVLEREEELDPALYLIETKAMGWSDMALGWILPAAALLMLIGHPLWPYLALVGSGIFLYFSAVTSLSRLYLRRAGRKVGRPASLRAAYLAGGIWSACAIAMIWLVALELSS